MALSGFLQNAVNKSVSVSKDINKNVQKGILQVEAINEIDLCNIISFFLTKAFQFTLNILVLVFLKNS